MKGSFFYENEEALDIKKSLNIPCNEYLGDKENITFGRVLNLSDLKTQDEGTYWLDNGENISIITLKNGEVKYELGRIWC